MRSAVGLGRVSRPAVNPPVNRFVSIPAPLRGWIENDNLAANRGLGCVVCENWFPTASSIRPRGGFLKRTEVGAPVAGLIPYRSGASEKLFASSDAGLYDISLFPTAVGPAVWTQTAGRRSYTQIAISGSEYVVTVNGSDFAAYYDGTDWNPIASTAISNLAYDGLTQAFVVGRVVTGGTSLATGTIAAVIPTGATTGTLKLRAVSGVFQDNEALTASGTAGGAAVANGVAISASTVTITNVDTASLSHVWQHNSRLWFIEQGTTKAWYLPIDSLGGAAVSYDVGGLLSQGGSLVFGATWASDSGSGFADRNVLVSTEGEIVVFEGIDPSDADLWGLVGHYRIGRPTSPQTWQAGGDLILSTEDGLVPMSAVATMDRASLSQASVSAAIEPSWKTVHRANLLGEPVQLLKWQGQSMGIVGFPHRSEAFVVNLVTGAWAKWTGLNVQSLVQHRGSAYFGDGSAVHQFEASGYDGTAPYVCRLSFLPDPLGAPGAYKVAHAVRATFRSLVPFRPKLSLAENYWKNFPAPPDTVLDSADASLWDIGTWDDSLWDNGPNSEERITAITQWVGVGATGVALSPQVQITAGGARIIDAELISFDVSYSVGGGVV